jgi:hypothetical protein
VYREFSVRAQSNEQGCNLNGRGPAFHHGAESGFGFLNGERFSAYNSWDQLGECGCDFSAIWLHDRLPLGFAEAGR